MMKKYYAHWEKIWQEELSPTWQLILAQLAQNPDYVYISSDLWRRKGTYEKADTMNLKSIFSSDKLRIRFYGDAGYEEDEFLDLRALSYFPNLHSLDLDAAITHIDGLTQCKSLKEVTFWSRSSLYYAMPFNANTYFVRSLKELESLHFFGNVGHLLIDLADIASLSRLQYLTLANTLQSTIADISPLHTLNHLTHLDISQTNVETLQPIWHLSLEFLTISEHISEKEVADYQKNHPNTEICRTGNTLFTS